jgi:hypothetical protein
MTPCLKALGVKGKTADLPDPPVNPNLAPRPELRPANVGHASPADLKRIAEEYQSDLQDLLRGFVQQQDMQLQRLGRAEAERDAALQRLKAVEAERDAALQRGAGLAPE